MEPQEQNPTGYRSLFWPVILIGAGVVLLLANLGWLAPSSPWLLLRLWPILLIGIGLDIIFARRAPLLGGIIALATLGLAAGVVLAAPRLNLPAQPEIKAEHFSDPIADAKSGRIDLSLSRYPTSLHALSGGSNLIDAQLQSVEGVSFRASGQTERVIQLSPLPQSGVTISGIWDLVEARWDIGLSPNVPLDLAVDVGSGSADLNLNGLTLTGVDLTGGSGHTQLAMPASEASYPVTIRSGSGGFEITIAPGAKLSASINGGSGAVRLDIGRGAAVEARIDGGSGRTTVNIPGGAALRVVVDHSGSGNVGLPSGLRMISDGGDNDPDTGIWESTGFASASEQIAISYTGGSGGLTVH